MSYSVISIDPGIRGCGVAIFADKVLVEACYVTNPAKRGNGPGESYEMAYEVSRHFQQPETLVLEWPQIYAAPQRGQKDPNNLLCLAGIDAALVGSLQPLKVEHFLPHEWKGNLPKETAHHPRVMARLSDDEKARIKKAPSADLQHNIVDAVGLGLFYLGRMDRKRIIAR